MKIPNRGGPYSVAGEEQVSREEEKTEEDIRLVEILHGALLKDKTRLMAASSIHLPPLKAHQIDQILMRLGRNTGLALLFFKKVGQQQGFQHTLFSVLTIAHILARARWLRELRAVLKQALLDKGCYSAPSICDFFRNAFKNWETSSSVLDMMVNIYSQAGLTRDAIFILCCMKDLGFRARVRSYNAVLSKVDCIDTVCDIFEEMQRCNICPDIYTYTIIIYHFCKHQKLQEAIEVLPRMEENDSKLMLLRTIQL